jgi:hypothetical protein
MAGTMRSRVAPELGLISGRECFWHPEEVRPVSQKIWVRFTVGVPASPRTLVVVYRVPSTKGPRSLGG